MYILIFSSCSDTCMLGTQGKTLRTMICMRDQNVVLLFFGAHRMTTWIAMVTLQSREKWELILKKTNVRGSLFKLCRRYPQNRCKY